MIDRAVQFIPFAALTGQGEAIEEITRVTEDRLELDEEKMEELRKAGPISRFRETFEGSTWKRV